MERRGKVGKERNSKGSQKNSKSLQTNNMHNPGSGDAAGLRTSGMLLSNSIETFVHLWTFASSDVHFNRTKAREDVSSISSCWFIQWGPGFIQWGIDVRFFVTISFVTECNFLRNILPRHFTFVFKQVFRLFSLNGFLFRLLISSSLLTFWKKKEIFILLNYGILKYFVRVLSWKISR